VFHQWKAVTRVLGAVLVAGACARGRPSNGAETATASGAVGAGGTATPEHFVGLKYPPFPEGLDEQGGTMLAVGGKFEFALNVVSKDSTTYVWLSRLTERNDAGEPGFEVRAVLPVPPLDSGEALLVGRCRMRSASDTGDRSLVAIARTAGHESEAELRDIREAWRADVDQEAFHAVPGDSVICANDVLSG
jgi:hypothetical protein